jgi:hypothetical protein
MSRARLSTLRFDHISHPVVSFLESITGCSELVTYSNQQFMGGSDELPRAVRPGFCLRCVRNE